MMYGNSEMYGWMTTGEWGLSHFLLFAIMAAVILYPLGLILKKLGYSPFWAVLACVPMVNIAGLWMIALGSKPLNANELTV